MKCWSFALLLAIASSVGCRPSSSTEEVIERIVYCVDNEHLDSLAPLVSIARSTPTLGINLVKKASGISADVLGATLAVAMPPCRSAEAFINMLANDATERDASSIARSALRSYNAMGLSAECDSFTHAVDSLAMALPVDAQAKILVGCVAPDKLGRHLSITDDTALIEAIRKAYDSDNDSLDRFNISLK